MGHLLKNNLKWFINFFLAFLQLQVIPRFHTWLSENKYLLILCAGSWVQSLICQLSDSDFWPIAWCLTVYRGAQIGVGSCTWITGPPCILPHPSLDQVYIIPPLESRDGIFLPGPSFLPSFSPSVGGVVWGLRSQWNGTQQNNRASGWVGASPQEAPRSLWAPIAGKGRNFPSLLLLRDY